jgi:hypothetical protein
MRRELKDGNGSWWLVASWRLAARVFAVNQLSPRHAVTITTANAI